MSLPEVTQDNVRLFIPEKVSRLCAQIALDEKISPVEALMRFYNSPTARQLQDETTKLWTLGWVGLYEFYRSAQ